MVASMPAQPLPGSHASPSMIAAVTAGKYVDGTPLYRMEDVLARSNIAVSRGTLANWIIRPAELHYKRIYDALKQVLRSQWLIHGDETTIQVLKEQDRKAQDKSYMWVYRTGAQRTASSRSCCSSINLGAVGSIRVPSSVITLAR
jgi:hypothetical protein